MRQFTSTVFRWTARCATLLVAGAFLYLLAGEMLNPHSGPPTTFREWTGIILFVACIAAMLLAWKWELSGAITSLATLTLFAVVIRMDRYDILVATALPGILFLGDWTLRRTGHLGASR